MAVQRMWQILFIMLRCAESRVVGTVVHIYKAKLAFDTLCHYDISLPVHVLHKQ